MLLETLKQHLSSGQLTSAYTLTRQLLEQEPENGAAWVALYNIYSQQEKNKEALIALERAADLLPSDIDVQLAYASRLFQSGDLSQAEARCLALIKKRSELSRPYVHLGRIAEQRGQIHAAEQYYSKALTLESDELYSRAGLGLLTMYQGKLPEAIHHFREVLSILLKGETFVRDSPPDNGFNRTEIETLMWKTLASMSANGVHAFLTGGALLGMEREGCLLPFDRDLDIAVPHQEIPQAARLLLSNGWEKVVLPMPMLTPLPFKHKATGIVLDIYAVEIEEGTGNVISGTWMKGIPWEWQRVIVFPGPLSLHIEVRPEGKVWTLDDKDSWLSALYGDWRTPDPYFSTPVCAYNQRSFSLLAQVYGYNRLTGLWKNGSIKRALHIAKYMAANFEDDVLLKSVHSHLQQVIDSSGTSEKAASSD
ncbi:tetratricopeptide repeat protein [Oceanospirillum sediminis]|uniref:Tetratricopeptide repeat protein n=1 Tax=Oceanospirillum sediminis TaxID=2760088 RepID=A0A839IRS2_9GAMM|nr:tetratricopeptide repeat protein [Oceanospirillum sediminis]